MEMFAPPIKRKSTWFIKLNRLNDDNSKMKLSFFSSAWVVTLLCLQVAPSCGSKLAGILQKPREEQQTPFHHRALPEIVNATKSATGAQMQGSKGLTRKLQEIFEGTTTVGFAVTIVNPEGKQVYARGFGQSNERKDQPYTVNTVQLIASVSKTLIGMSLMKCKEMGALDLDDPINDYLPFPIVNPYFPDEPITIRHLATHTSSLRDTMDYERAYIFNGKLSRKIWSIFPKGSDDRKGTRSIVRLYNSNQDMPLPDFVQNMYDPDGEWYDEGSAFSQDSAPGVEFSYSNMGSAIASMVIEGAVKKKLSISMSYIDFVNTYITKPLKMKSSGWDMADYKPNQKTKLYQWGRMTDPPIPIPDFKLITVADGNFVTNVQDMAKYLAAVIQGVLQGKDNVLTAESYFQMLDEGIFWFYPMHEHEGRYSFGHTGGDPGVVTSLLVDPESQYGYYYAANSGDGDIDAVMPAMMDFVAGL